MFVKASKPRIRHEMGYVAAKILDPVAREGPFDL